MKGRDLPPGAGAAWSCGKVLPGTRMPNAGAGLKVQRCGRPASQADSLLTWTHTHLGRGLR